MSIWLNYAFKTIETAFKIKEVERDTLSDRIDAFVEYKPDARWTIRVFGKNLSNSPATRTRWISQGLRGSSGRLSGGPDPAERALFRRERPMGFRWVTGS